MSFAIEIFVFISVGIPLCVGLVLWSAVCWVAFARWVASRLRVRRADRLESFL